MNMYKRLAAFFVATALSFAPAIVSAVDTWHLPLNRGGVESNYDLDDPTGEIHVLVFNISTGYQSWVPAGTFKSYFIDPFQYVNTTALASAIASATSTTKTTTDSLQSQIDGLGNTITALSAYVSAIGASGSFSVGSFMANQASTTPYVASSTFNGFMSGAMFSKLAALSTSTPSFATTTRTTTTGTGATGYQISSTRNTFVTYSGKVTASATIGSPSEGYIALEIAPTNSATAGDWVQIGVCGGGQNITLAALLTSVQQSYCNLNGVVPAGYYAKLRAVTVSDTPTFSILSSQEVQL